MMQKSLQAIVLAGGVSEHFQTGKTKLIEKICGKEMILYPLELLKTLNLSTTAVLGTQHDRIIPLVESYNKNIQLLQQKQDLGSGHAASLSKKLWSKEHILLINADIPLLTEETINKLYNKHVKTDADISFITAHGVDIENKNYSRIVINNNKIHVLNDSTAPENIDSQCCVIGGVYIAKRSFLEKYMDTFNKGDNKKFQLPELVQVASNNNCKIVTSPVSIDTIRCINSLSDLWAVEHIKRSQIIQHWMNNGVRFENAITIMIDETVIIEPGVYIGSSVHLLGNTVVKAHSTVNAYSFIKHSTIEKGCYIKSHTVITHSTIQENSIIHPFTHIDHQNVITSTTTKNKHSSKTFTGAIKTKHINTQQDL